MNYRRPVFDILAERFPRTLLLAGVGYAFGLLIGIMIGIQSAVTPHRSVDQAWSSLVLIGYAMPTFWVGQLLVMGFSIHLGWLPTQGMGPMISRASGVDWLLERAAYLVLAGRHLHHPGNHPAWHVSCVPACGRTLEQGYIVTARQKGLSRREIIMGHVVRNSILPVITVMGVLVRHRHGRCGPARNGLLLPGCGIPDGRGGPRPRHPGDRGRGHPDRLLGGRHEYRGRSALRVARSQNSRLVSARLAGRWEGHRCLRSQVSDFIES